MKAALVSCLAMSLCPLAAGEVLDLRWSSRTNLEWSADATATSFNIYVGDPSNLPKLVTTQFDSCGRLTVTTNSSGPVLTETPPTGAMFWYLATRMTGAGEGSAGNATSGPRILNSTGACTDSCVHDKCLAGPILEAACDPCVADLCAIDPYCCNTDWDIFCVREVRTWCLSLVCAESQGACAHTLCTVDTLLSAECDDPPVSPSCAGAICTADAYCCNTEWDGVCVGEVDSVCGYNCNW